MALALYKLAETEQEVGRTADAARRARLDTLHAVLDRARELKLLSTVLQPGPPLELRSDRVCRDVVAATTAERRLPP